MSEGCDIWVFGVGYILRRNLNQDCALEVLLV